MLLFPSLCRSYFMGRLREAKSWPVILLKRDSNTYAFLWYCSIFINSFFIDLWWYSKKWLQNFKDNMLCNSISVDMKVYVLQLNSKSATVVFHWMLQNLSTVTFENNFRSCFQKENKEGGEDAKWPFWFQVFTFSRTVIYQVMKQSSFSTNFHTVEPFSLDCYPFL